MTYASSAEKDGNVMSLERTATIARKEMVNRSFISTGTFSQHFRKKSVPHTLLATEAIILVVQTLNSSHEAHLNVNECTRHVKSQEIPFPVCIGCMVPANKEIEKLLTDCMFLAC